MSKTNRFSSKFQAKSISDLQEIISSPQHYQEDALQAAKWELEKRQLNKIPEEGELQRNLVSGEERYKAFIGSIKKETSFAGTPKYNETFSTALPTHSIRAIAHKAFERLEWDVIYSVEKLIEAKRQSKTDQWREKISISIEGSNKVKVKSTSLGSENIDIGRNSIRVKLFIHVFKEVESELDADSLKVLEEELSKKDNWDDYEIPESLPKPRRHKEPNLIIPVIFGLFASIILGALFAICSRFVYIIILFESIIGVALSYMLFQGVKIGNFTSYLPLRSIMGFSVIAIVILNQYFQYHIILYENNNFGLTFFQFIEMRIQNGFVFKSLNTGWIGWLIVIVLQLVVIYYLCWFRLIISITNFQIKRIPEEVLNFAIYHFIKGKSEAEVEHLLSMKGWVEKQDHKHVFEAIGSIQGQQEIVRAE